MEIQLRIVLLIVGLLILCGVAIDIFRRRPVKQSAGATFVDNYRSNPPVASYSSQRVFIDDLATESDDVLIDDIASETLENEAYLYATNLVEDSDATLTLEPEVIHEQDLIHEPEVVPYQDVIVVYIMSRAPGGFDGDELYTALSNAHFYLGNNNIFYRHENDDGTGLPLFSLVKAVEPGYFDIELLPREKIPGVTLLLIPGKVQKPSVALDKLVRAAKQIAFVLNGELLDHARQALTLTTIDSYKTQIEKNS